MANIDLFVCVTSDTIIYAEFVKKISSLFLSGNHKINWKCIYSGGVKKQIDGYEHIGTAEKCKNCPSMSHGKALNKAFKRSKENYVIMMDSDIVFLYQGWDDIVVKNLDIGNTAFGVSSPSIINRHQNFPFIYCFCYRVDLLNNISLDFRPRINASNRIKFSTICSDYEKEVTGLQIGSRFRWETSSRIPFIFYDNNFKNKSLKCILGNDRKAKLPFLNDHSKKKYLKVLMESKAKKEYMEEWHWDNKLFATHLRVSISNNFNNEYTQHWIERIRLYIKNRYGKIL